jgi:hypothetical protein
MARVVRRGVLEVEDEQPAAGGQQRGAGLDHPAAARKVLGSSRWPKRCKLAHAFLREYSYKGLKLAHLLGQLGLFLACGQACGGTRASRR